MSPVTPISQQPQLQTVELTTPQTNGIVSQQPTQTETMKTEPQMHLRGGGMVGDCFEAICVFECCKGMCNCCC
ncbi:hypothetical protein LHYA1_G002083 [Lachnellula hyalina]|uniref:Uncharacterized protein n=1 Tax=Lachnellula hyalina TaxID=1316788 RepID=A0A8H8R6Y5_9HELO|nr:uncharacterized protein LHYA1_G002083 [Lachnellula hyalina]TVY28835.1 hypothetical protein LHYA1_G002083 [Lachnellula hyalina]